MKKWGVLIGTGMASMLITIDFTIVNTALVPIQKSLGSSLSDLQWFISAYGIPFCVLLVICGRLGDLIGRRLILYIGMIGFGLASLAAGFSHTSFELIIARFFQGLFGASVFPCGMALTSEVFPKSERGRALGIYMGLLGVGLAIGPAIGGFITDALNWHWIFFINMPILVLSFLFCLPTVSESKLKEKQKIDWKGLFLLLIGLSALITWITEGPNLGWFSFPSLLLVAVSVLFLWMYYKSEKTCKFPIVPFSLFKNRGFILGVLNFIASISCMWAVIFLVPLYLQGLLGYPAVTAGMLLLIMTAMTVIAPPAAGHMLDKKGEKGILYLIFAFLILGYVLILFFSATGALWALVASFLLIGLAWGSGNGIGGPLVLSDHATTAHTGLITGSATTILNVVGVLLLSISGTILRFFEKSHFMYLLDRAGISLTPEQQQNVPSSLSGEVLRFFHQSFQFGFDAAIVFLLLFTVAILLMVRKVLAR